MCIEIGLVHFCSRGISSVVGVLSNGGAAAATVANKNSYQLQPNCEMNWTSPFSPLRVGGQSSCQFTNNDGAEVATVANMNSYQLQPHCDMKLHWIWTSPFSPLRVGGISPVVGVVGDGGAAAATAATVQRLAADVGKVYSTRLLSHRRRVLCTPGYLTNFSRKRNSI